MKKVKHCMKVDATSEKKHNNLTTHKIRRKEKQPLPMTEPWTANYNYGRGSTCVFLNPILCPTRGAEMTLFSITKWLCRMRLITTCIPFPDVISFIFQPVYIKQNSGIKISHVNEIPLKTSPPLPYTCHPITVL